MTGVFVSHSTKRRTFEPDHPDVLTDVHKVLDGTAPRTGPEADRDLWDYRTYDILLAHTMHAFAAVARAIAEHPGFRARCENDWPDQQHSASGLRWCWTDETGEHTALIQAVASRREHSVEFRVYCDDRQIGDEIRWPLASLNSSVTIPVCVQMLQRIHPRCADTIA